jgi:hypothetical protein
MAHRINFIAERLEETPQEQFAAAAWKNCKTRFEWDWCAREFRLALAPA